MEALNRYLFHHKRLSIPGLGTLYMERVPARTDFVNARILPPVYRFRFDQYFDAPEEDLFVYLSKQLALPDYEAIRWYNEFAYGIRAKIRAEEQAIWPGLGRFVSDDRGEISFETAQPPFALAEPVVATRIIRQHADHAVLIGDHETTVAALSERSAEGIHVERESWWIYALVIAAVAISLGAYHFFMQDKDEKASGNQQEVPSYQMPSTSRPVNR